MARRTAQQAAQNVAPALVRRHNAVADHKGGAADMVGDDAQGNILFRVFAVFHIGNTADVLHDILNGIDKEQIVHVLHNAGKTLQSHAGVDIRMFHRRVVALTVAVELGKHDIPEFHIPVAVAAHAAGRGAAAVLFPAVKVDFGAGAAGAGAMLPEIVLFAQADNVGRVNPYFLRPDFKRFVVICVNGHPKFVNRHVKHLGAEFPCPCGGFMLKIISE